MSHHNRDQSQQKTTGALIGIAISAFLAILCAATGHPGLMGVGIVIALVVWDMLEHRSLQ